MIIWAEYTSIVQNFLTFLIIAVAFWQLNRIRKHNSISIILELEKELRQSTRNLHEIALKWERQKGNPIKLSESERRVLLFQHNKEFKLYANILDRISFCILKKYLLGKAIRKEYERIIIKLIESKRINEENNHLYKLYHQVKKNNT